MKGKLLSVLLVVLGVYLNAQTGSIKGIVGEEDLGTLPQASILLKPLNKGVISDLNGNFIIQDIAEGSYTMVITYLGFEEKSVDVQVKANETTDLGTIYLLPTATELGEVTVQGEIRNQEAKALHIKRVSPRIVEVIAADGIGKLPDRNAGEAVQRVSGVSIERDQGEGRFVAVRGLPAQWNSTTINGDRIPTAEEETVNRATAFDFFPSDMIQFVEVSKAITPDQEGDAMGGSVNFITRTAPTEKTLNVTLGGGFNQKSAREIGSANVLFGNRSKDGKFGYLVNGTVWHRNWATDNYEPRRKSGGVYRLELRDYTGQRRTMGLNVASEYKPTDNTKFYVKGLYGTLTDDELHYKHRLRFDKMSASAPQDGGRVELQNIHDVLITRMIGGEVGAEHTSGNSTIDWKLASYENKFFYGDIPDADNRSYYVVKFKQSGVPFDASKLDAYDGKYRLNFGPDGGPFDINNLDQVMPTDGSFKMDPTKMEFADLNFYKVEITEKDKIVGALNYENKFGDSFTLKAGFKYRDKVREARFADEYWVLKDGEDDIFMADAGNVIEQPGASGYMEEVGSNFHNMFGGVLDVESTDNFWAKYGDKLELDSAESALVENGGAIGRNFDLNERHTSGYVMGTYKVSDKFTVLGGVRATQTYSKVNGWNYIEDENRVEETESEKTYLSVLPMLHMKIAPSDAINIRLAATRTFARPDFGMMVPGGAYMSQDEVYTGGNPDLNPTYSWNLDAMADYFFGNLGVINVGMFYKHITAPIFEERFVGDVLSYQDITVNMPRNGEDAWLSGLEAGINKKLTFLPGFLSGFGVNANFTRMWSEMTIPGRQGFTRIPRQANNLVNVALYYETAKFSARLAVNHKGGYIMEHGSNADDDAYYDKYTSMDMTAGYQVSDNFRLFMEVNNMLNNPMLYYLGTEDRPLQLEYYGMRGQVGVKWNL